MNDEQLQTIEQVKQFLEGSEAVEFRGLTTQEKYHWIEEALFAHRLDIFSLNLDLMLHLLWRTESRGAGEGS